MVLVLLREMRAEQQRQVASLNAKVDDFINEQRATNERLERKIDKMSIQLGTLGGRVRNSEELLESICRVISEGSLIDR